MVPHRIRLTSLLDLDYLLGEKICLVCFVESVSYYMTILLSGGTIAIVSFLFEDCYVRGRSPGSC